MINKYVITAFILFAVLMSGCSNSSSPTSQKEKDNSHVQHAANGDLQEKTGSADQLPSFLDGKPDDMKTIYQASAKHADLLQYIPCYCGCGEFAGHKSNLNCFVAKVGKDGSIVWDDHGTRCKVCLDIAAESITQFNDGKTPAQIRDYVDSAYKEGYAKPTPTPMPNV